MTDDAKIIIRAQYHLDKTRQETYASAFSDHIWSKSDQFIFVSICTKITNLVKFPQAVCNTWCLQTLAMHAETDTCPTQTYNAPVMFCNLISSLTMQSCP